MFETLIYYSTKAIEICGVLVIIGGALLAAFSYVKNYQHETQDTYEAFRRQLGRSILLGLEFLVAADIIATVAIKPSLESVAILGVIVIIRTFLSFSLEIELEGKLPWKSKDN
jgi:uncharacterized membrane protein